MCAYIRPWHIMWAATSWEEGEIHGEIISVHVQWRKLLSTYPGDSTLQREKWCLDLKNKQKTLQSLHTRQYILDLWLIRAFKAVIFKYKSLVFHYPICAIDITLIMEINRSSPETKLSFRATPYSKVGKVVMGFWINYTSLSCSLLTVKRFLSLSLLSVAWFLN